MRLPAYGVIKPRMSRRDLTIKPKKGRPEVDSEAVHVRLDRASLIALDDWRREQTDLPGRPEAIRRLIEIGLAAKKKRV